MVFVYYVEIEKIHARNFTAFTLTFNVTKFKVGTAATQSIRIDGDFE